MHSSLLQNKAKQKQKKTDVTAAHLKLLREELSHEERAPGDPRYLVALLGRRFLRMTMTITTTQITTITRTPTTTPMMTLMELLGASAVKEIMILSLFSSGPASRSEQFTTCIKKGKNRRNNVKKKKNGGGSFFLTYKDFVRMFDHSFPTYMFFILRGVGFF